MLPKFCVALDEGIFEWNDIIDNDDRFADYVAHSPGAGWRNFIHYGQIVRDKQF